MSRWVPGSQEIQGGLSRGSLVAADRREGRTIVSLGRYTDDEWTIGLVDGTGRLEALQSRARRTTGDSSVVTERSMSFLGLDADVEEPDWLEEAVEETADGGNEGS